jgi:hypothetical protein
MMAVYKPVEVHKGSFAFCRYGMAVLTWLALALQSRPLVVAAGIVMLLSALLTVRRAPLIVLWNVTGERLRRSPVELLDEHAMRFAHSFGFALFAIDSLLLSLRATSSAGWVFLAVVGVAKTIGALGFCAAGKMYTCAVGNGGKCCAFWQRGR